VAGGVKYQQQTIDIERLIWNPLHYPSTDYQDVDILDFELGALLYSDNSFIGAELDHILQPNVGFFGNSPLPRKLTVIGGGDVWSNDNLVLYANGRFTVQQGYRNILARGGVKLRQLNLELGYASNNQYVAGVGYSFNKVKIGYAIDIYPSKVILTSHELGVVWNVKCKGSRKSASYL